jgi:hypothetical protein
MRDVTREQTACLAQRGVPVGACVSRRPAGLDAQRIGPECEPTLRKPEVATRRIPSAGGRFDRSAGVLIRHQRRSGAVIGADPHRIWLDPVGGRANVHLRARVLGRIAGRIAGDSDVGPVGGYLVSIAASARVAWLFCFQ